MRGIGLFIFGLFSIVVANAQPKAEQQAIKNLCGCYEVDFKYAETFAADTSYKYHPRYHVSGLEWIAMNEVSDKKFVIQHLLVAEDTFVIKHWREDWEFEKTDWWLFNHDATWKHETTNKQTAKGQWTQTVWEVDDAPRYQGSSNWVSTNGKYYWENTTDAPLPRREYTKRKDYNVMQRTNRIIVTDTGWMHEQDNKKIIRKDGVIDKYLAEEKGYNYYKKTDDSKCKQAAIWWEQHKLFWATVRQSWDELLEGKNTIKLVPKVNGKLLYEQLDVLQNETLTQAPSKEKIKRTLIGYIDNGSSQASAMKGGSN